MSNKNKNIIRLVTVISLILIAIIVPTVVVVVNNANTLATPELEFVSEKGLINWDAVENAGSYRVVIDDTETTTIQPTYQLTERGKHIVKVTALPSEDNKKLKESIPAVLEVTYTTTIETPKISITRYKDGGIRYIIENYDEDAESYAIGIDTQTITVKEARGVLDTKLKDGKYEVRVKGIGDNVKTRDSEVAKTFVEIKPVPVHTATYETKSIRNDFEITLDTKEQSITRIMADFYDIDERSYSFDKISGKLIINENILLGHVGDEPQLIEISFADGNVELIEITINDNRLVEIGEYLSVYSGSDAKFSFNIYRNTLENIELIKIGGDKETLVLDTGYKVTYDGFKATVTITKPNRDTDSSLVLRFKKGDETYERTIKYYFRDSTPNVFNTYMTYNKASANRADIKIMFDPASAITEITMPYATASDYSYDNTLGVITVKKSYLDAFDSGAIMNGRVFFGSDETPFSIHVIDESATNFAIATLAQSEYTYELNSESNVEIALSDAVRLSAVSFDGIKMDKEYYSYVKGKLTLKPIYLDTIGYGRHEVRLHVDDVTTYDVVAHITIDVVDITPTELTVTIDNTFPELSFNYKNLGPDVSTYVTNKRTGKTYYNVGDENRVLINILEFKNEDKYTVTNERGNEVKTSPELTYKERKIEGYEKYYNAKFTYGGESYDAVLTSNAEFTTFVHYAMMRVSKMRAYDVVGIKTDERDTMLWSKADRPYEYSVKVYTPFMNVVGQDYIDSIKAKLVSSARVYKEPNSVDFKVSIDPAKKNECTISFRVKSTNVPYMADETGHEVKETRYNLGYEVTFKTDSPRPQSYDDFKINTWQKTQSVYITDELYYAIEDGARPVPVTGSPAEEMLDRIKAVNRSIIDDSMSDAEKFMAIYDWVISNTTYDQNTADYESRLSQANYPSVYPRRCFFLEGVFVDHVAVCNGYAKAVVVMAGLEGIEAKKVLGYTGKPFSKQRHAWIKVKLDGVWYNSEPTWGSNTELWKGESEGPLTAEGSNHLHTLIADKPFEDSYLHTPDDNFRDNVSNIAFNYFANVVNGRAKDGEMNTLVINSDEDIKKAVAEVDFYARNSDVIAIPVYGRYADLNTKFAKELRAVTEIDTWKFTNSVIISKYGYEYKTMIFKR